MRDDSNEDKLSPLQRQAALLAAHGMSQADIARRLNHSKQTINKWFGLSEFQAHVDQLVRRLEAEFTARIRAALPAQFGLR